MQLTLAPAPTNMMFWTNLNIMTALTSLDLVFYGPRAMNGSLWDSLDEPVCAAPSLTYVSRLPHLKFLSLTSRRWSPGSEMVHLCEGSVGYAMVPLFRDALSVVCEDDVHVHCICSAMPHE